MEKRLRFIENWMLRKIFGPESDEANYIMRFVIFTLHQMSFG
jgi:hypothetical protein